MSHPPGPSGQPYVPTEAEQAEHLRNLKSRLKEFWVEQMQEVLLRVIWLIDRLIDWWINGFTG